MRGNEKTATGKGQIEHRGNEKKLEEDTGRRMFVLHIFILVLEGLLLDFSN